MATTRSVARQTRRPSRWSSPAETHGSGLVLGAGLRYLPSTPAQLLARRAVRGSVTEPSLVRVDRLATSSGYAGPACRGLWRCRSGRAPEAVLAGEDLEHRPCLRSAGQSRVQVGRHLGAGLAGVRRVLAAIGLGVGHLADVCRLHPALPDQP